MATRAVTIACSLALATVGACSGDDLGATSTSSGPSTPLTSAEASTVPVAPGTTATTDTVDPDETTSTRDQGPPSSGGDSTTSPLSTPSTDSTISTTDVISNGTTIPTTAGSTTTVAPFDATVTDPPASMSAAVALDAMTGCDENDPRIAYAQLSWTPAASGGTQRIQITADPSGFAAGPVVTGPELSDDADEARWFELTGQAVHSWRVITASPDRDVWYAGSVSQFEGPVCAVDYQNG